ncbi:MAG: polysaccharide deacetylase family protein [Rectinemataceae bacterium]
MATQGDADVVDAMMHSCRGGRIVSLALLFLFAASTLSSQVIPAQYWPMPKGFRAQTSESPPVELPKRKNPQILVLVYHNLVYGRPGNEIMRDLYNFENDLAYLARNYRIIDFHDLAAIAEGRQKLVSDAAIITFDDGDLSMYAIAFPLLRAYGIKATFFIISGMLGQVGYIAPAQMREMSQWKSPDGRRLFDFQSHSENHNYFSHLKPEELNLELVRSKHAIEAITGRTVDTVALPFGDGAFLPGIQAAAKAAGYTRIRTTSPLPMSASSIDRMGLSGFNVTSYSSDRFVSDAERMMGRSP